MADRLPEHWEDTIQRIARISASRFLGGTQFTYHERIDFALGGIIEHLADHGWPDIEKPLFRAADYAIRREDRERTRHIKHWSYWYEPRGVADPIGEKVTDRIAVWQVVWELTEGQWAAVWALAEVMKRGGNHVDAAALIGKTYSQYNLQLSLARKRIRALWVAPGDTPPKLWTQDKRSATTSATLSLRRRTRDRARRRAA